eukprot:Skav202823  [mRNA]  locus=scaffold3852:121758:131501:- [translate_table: standard]
MFSLLFSAALAVSVVAEDCAVDGTCAQRNSGSTFLQFASRVRQNSTENTCDPFSQWPDLDEVTCGGCQALVKTDNFQRCDRYCESFGHTCIAAAEEEAEDCIPKGVVWLRRGYQGARGRHQRHAVHLCQAASYLLFRHGRRGQ